MLILLNKGKHTTEGHYCALSNNRTLTGSLQSAHYLSVLSYAVRLVQCPLRAGVLPHTERSADNDGDVN